MRTIQLSMSPNYVKHWGLWEALREILQNALDAKSKGHSMEVYDYNVHGVSPHLRISNGGPALSRSMLLLGQTTKQGDDTQIGQFGEGFKLALLVLCRLGHQVNISTGNELWTPCLRHSEEFGCDVLTIDITERMLQDNAVVSSDGVEFSIHGTSTEALKGLYEPNMPINRPLPDKAGMVFIQGLFVCKVEGFKYGYNLSSDRLKLDRDRGMVDGFDLAYQTSRIWTDIHHDDAEFGDNTLLDLINEKAKDVEYVNYHVPKASPVEARLVSSYSRSYGDAIPVSTQAEITQAVAAGKKFQLVPDSLKAILWRAVGFFIPSVGTPAQRLNAFIKKHKSSLSDSQVAELRDIIKALPGEDNNAEGEDSGKPS